MVKYQLCGISGGTGGASFDDRWFLDSASVPAVRTILAFADENYVHSIQMTWDGNIAGGAHGGPGGAEYLIQLDSDEYIDSIDGAHDTYVKWMGITTNKKLYIIGKPELTTQKFLYMSCPGKQRIVGFWGRCGDLVDAIGVHFMSDF
jgi:Jacalin-like lectin domain